MRERAALLGGTAEVKGTPGQGTIVTVRVPFEGAKA
jgi:signal transduction histidine kinase